VHSLQEATDTTLTKGRLKYCNIGNQQQATSYAALLVAAFHSNRPFATTLKTSISLSDLMQNIIIWLVTRWNSRLSTGIASELNLERN
jgi:hypothetical protein